MIAVKSIKLDLCSDVISSLMEEFRSMVNEAIRIGIERNIISKLRLRNEIYSKFKNGFHTSCISMAVFKSHALLKSYRRALKKNPCTKQPYIWKEFLIVDSGAYRIFYDHVQIPTRPRQFVVIPLNHYVSKILSDHTLKFGNLTLTPNTYHISFKRDQGAESEWLQRS